MNDKYTSQIEDKIWTVLAGWMHFFGNSCGCACLLEVWCSSGVLDDIAQQGRCDFVPLQLRPIRLLLVFLLLVVFLRLPLLPLNDYNYSCSTTTITFPVRLPKSSYNDSCQTTQKFIQSKFAPKVPLKSMVRNIQRVELVILCLDFFHFFSITQLKKIDYVECDHLNLDLKLPV